jgi:RimJ/RimL family protein N-acetyltransferase
MTGAAIVSLRPYAAGDQWLLERTLGDPTQMVHLNGPESAEKIARRHLMLVAMSADPRVGCQFTILAGPERAEAGNVGYWESEWKGVKGWEMGWFILPQLQRQGIATAATQQVLERLAALDGPRLAFAFPSVDNVPSNAICRAVGFELSETVDSEYPPGSGRTLRVNVWKRSLPMHASAARTTSAEAHQPADSAVARRKL